MSSKLRLSKHKWLWISLGTAVILALAFLAARFAVHQPSTPGDSGAVQSTFEAGYQIIRMDVVASGWKPASFSLKQGIPVKWIINGKELTNCNNAIDVPSLSLHFQIHKGEQTIEFIPDRPGVIAWSCWMGMINGSFIVEK
jgi:plastocyanin domain-containing protein